MNPDYINSIIASKMLHVSVKTFYNYVNAGKITKYLDKGNGRYRFLKKDIENFMIPAKPRWRFR